MGWRVSWVIIPPVSRETICSIGSYGAGDVLWNPEPNLLPSLYHFILQLRLLGWQCVSFETLSDFNCPFLSVSVQLLSCVQLFATAWTAAPSFPCPSPTPRACSNSRPSSQWCHPTISFSVIPFASCLQSFPASGFFPVSQFFASGGQRIGASLHQVAKVLELAFITHKLQVALERLIVVI